MYLVSAKEMRELDRLTIEQYGTPSHVLMERAGTCAAEAIVAAFPHVQTTPVLVVAGKGNNGGDGFVIARLLKKRGIKCEVILAARKEEVRGDALRNLTAFVRMRGKVSEVTDSPQLDLVQEKLSHCGLVVDALLGTGLNAPVQGLLAALIDLINASGVPVVAVDIPSGLDTDRGEPLGTAIQADLTVTFGYPKLGQVTDSGALYTGALVVADIGIAPEAVATVQPHTELLTAEEVGALVHARPRAAHKGDFGHLLVMAGARGKSGAALMCGGAGLRVGTGLVTLAGPASLNAIFSSAWIEAMTIPMPERPDGSFDLDEAAVAQALQGKTAIAFGPGVGVSVDTIGLTRWLLANSRLPLVIDADGLNCLATDPSVLRQATVPVVLTPHPGEMARLTGKPTAAIQADRLGTARDFATQYGCYLVLKGAHTVIAAPDGRCWVNPTGNPGMASGGMGDVLTGILGGLLAQGYAPHEACMLGVFLHGYAGDLAAQEKGEAGILARDVIERLPQGLRALRHAALGEHGAEDDP
ncbi:MAG: NAD(P)H-hydrate dehydratase [Candidatus Binatia bacterium]|nr:NAD(P)H-hydrate dehydratase [Candidatus Binatia bacterium]